MKKEVGILIIILSLTVGMGGCRQSGIQNNELITLDVTVNYSKKELILQDFMDVEYIPLETDDEFITQANVLAVSDKYMVIRNWMNDGNIFIFERKTGKGIRKINRRGQGGEEYVFVNGIVLDEDKNEIFVNCYGTKKIFVYDLSGSYKRSFNHTEGRGYLHVFDYDNDNLICYDVSEEYKDGQPRSGHSYHVIISKQDGSVNHDISIPFDVIRAPIVQKSGGMAITRISPIIPYFDDWLLIETSSDTVYHYQSKEDALVPFLVKTPSSTDPEIMLTMGPVADPLYFIKTIKKEFDFTGDFATNKGFPSTDLMYDMRENAFYNTTVLNGDYVNKQEVDITSRLINSEIATWQALEVVDLIEAYENDELKGKLKEIAANLDEEANPVIMLIKYKR